MSYKVNLPVFEGPFDLLVYLIESSRMSIYDIQISEITEQYLAYVDAMKDVDPEGASDFMVLAATLLAIKTKMMLPSYDGPGDGTEQEDPRSELVERILEYKRYKEMAEILDELYDDNAYCYEKPQEDISRYTENPDEVLNVTAEKFEDAFNQFLQREKRMASVRRHYQRIEREKITIEYKMAYIRLRLGDALSHGLKMISMRRLVEDRKNPDDVIVTFSSILQMMKERQIDAVQEKICGEIFVIPPRVETPEPAETADTAEAAGTPETVGSEKAAEAAEVSDVQ